MADPSKPEIVVSDATAEEAAAVIAALEQFLRDHAVVVAPDEGPRLSPWQAAALREGVNRAPDSPPFWA